MIIRSIENTITSSVIEENLVPWSEPGWNTERDKLGDCNIFARRLKFEPMIAEFHCVLENCHDRAINRCAHGVIALFQPSPLVFTGHLSAFASIRGHLALHTLRRDSN